MYLFHEAIKELDLWFNKDWVKLTKEFINRLSKILFINENELWKDIIRGLQSTGYGKVEGEDEVREVISHNLRERFDIEIPSENIILTLGAAEAIGKLFEAFRRLDNYLQSKSVIATLSPVYGPYNSIMLNREISGDVLSLDVSEKNNYEPDDKMWENFIQEAKIKQPKVFILVNPNNPTGRSFSENMIKKLGDFTTNFSKDSKRPHIPIIEDIVYADFVPKNNFRSVTKYYRENAIIVGSMSKYFRATGNRLGFLAIPPETNEYFTNRHFALALKQKSKDYNKNYDFINYFKLVKGPDPSGALYHTHLVPKVAQYLAMIKLLLDDGKEFNNEMKLKWSAFYRGIRYSAFNNLNQEEFAPYYCLVNFYDLIKDRQKEFPNLFSAVENKIITPENLISYLAKNGLIVLPASTFFVGKSVVNKDWFIRFSVANIEKVQVKKAIEIINNTLKELNSI